MKTCGFENQINPYLDGELSGAKLRSFEAHLQECPRCREEVEQYRGLLQELHGLEDMEVPAELHERLHAALSEELSKGAGRVKRRINPWAITAAAAAVVLVCVGGAMLANGFVSHNNLNLMQAPTMAPAATAADMAKGAADGYSIGESTNGNYDGAYAEPTAEASMAPAEAPQMDMRSTTKGGQPAQGFAGAETPNALQAQNNAANAEEGRKIIYTANLVIETRDYDRSVSSVESLIAKYGGYKQGSQENGVPDAGGVAQARSAVISIRMPISKYDAAMGELKALGNVVSKNEYTEDVSRQYVDTEARNRTLKAERDKLYELLAKADTMESIIALQDRITELTTEIEQMTAQLRYWDDKVSYSTITVELHELVTPKVVKPVDPDLNARMGGALNQTLNNMKKGLEDFSVRFVGFLPWLAVILLIAAILVAVLVPVVRRARRAMKKDEANNKEESK